MLDLLYAEYLNIWMFYLKVICINRHVNTVKRNVSNAGIAHNMFTIHEPFIDVQLNEDNKVILHIILVMNSKEVGNNLSCNK